MKTLRILSFITIAIAIVSCDNNKLKSDYSNLEKNTIY